MWNNNKKTGFSQTCIIITEKYFYIYKNKPGQSTDMTLLGNQTINFSFKVLVVTQIIQEFLFDLMTKK